MVPGEPHGVLQLDDGVRQVVLTHPVTDHHGSARANIECPSSVFAEEGHFRTIFNIVDYLRIISDNPC